MSTSASRPTLSIITGASRGMGLEIARQLLQPNARILTIARNPNPDLAEAAEQQQAHLEQWPADLTDAQPLEERLQAWLHQHQPAEWGTVQLINNAGMIPSIAPLSRTSASQIAQGLRVGLEAAMILSASFLQATEPWHIPRKILNISSGLGRRGMASQAVYCAAKAGMDNFSRCIALEEALKPNGAQIASLAPGVINTDMQTQMRHTASSAFPDVARFQAMHAEQQLLSPQAAATLVLQHLNRAEFGNPVIADVRDA